MIRIFYVAVVVPRRVSSYRAEAILKPGTRDHKRPAPSSPGSYFMSDLQGPLTAITVRHTSPYSN